MQIKIYQILLYLVVTFIWIIASRVQPYKYAGKEFDRTHGLDWYDFGARMLDPTLAKWTAPDPLSEKYYHISPYAYCAGNPVKFSDPTGKTISVTIGDETYRYNFGSSSFVDTGGNQVQLDDAFGQSVLDALNTLCEGANGRSLVEYLVNDETHNVSIIHSEKNSYNRDGNFYSVGWNEMLNEGGPSYFGIGNDFTRERPSFVGLGHELAHTQDSWQGKMDNSKWFATNKGYIVTKSEIYACSVENKIRLEHGIPLRTHYLYYNDESIVPTTSLFSPYCTLYLIQRNK